MERGIGGTFLSNSKTGCTGGYSCCQTPVALNTKPDVQVASYFEKCFDVEHIALFTAFRIIPSNSTILCKEVKNKN
jgi:hypothetical protein